MTQLIATAAVIAAAMLLPYTPASDLLGFTPLPLSFLSMLGAVTILYVVISEATKRLFYGIIDQYDER